MTNLAERLARPWRRTTLLAVLALLALLASCGPGTGGTGTGPISFAADVAAGSMATGAISTPAAPCSSCTHIELRLQDQRVELHLPCGRFVFTGPWSPDASELTLPGTIEVAGASSLATLRLQFGTEGARSPQVVVRLFDAAGAQVAAATLQRRDSLPVPDACP